MGICFTYIQLKLTQSFGFISQGQFQVLIQCPLGMVFTSGKGGGRILVFLQEGKRGGNPVPLMFGGLGVSRQQGTLLSDPMLPFLCEVGGEAQEGSCLGWMEVALGHN